MPASDVLTDWLHDVQLAATAHKLAAARCERLNRGLGIPVVALSAIVGSSIITTLL